MGSVEIVIPNYVTVASAPIVLRCLKSVRWFSREARLIFVDNASPALDLILPELDKHDRVQRIMNSTNLGFVKAVNQGLKASTADYVVLLNNDTEVVINWLDRMKAAFTGRVGIVGPRSQPNGTLSGDMPYRSATILPQSSMLVFFCAMISRACIERVGLLDEAFGVGLGDDDDFCWRTQQAGFDLCYLGDLTIFHHHKATFKQLYSPVQIHDMGMNALKILRRKSEGAGGLPPQCLKGRPA